jgi:hypothetical protein
VEESLLRPHALNDHRVRTMNDEPPMEAACARRTAKTQ